MAESSSEQASTSELKLPSRKSYITGLSTVAFLTGITVATVVTIRRGKRMRMEEMQSGSRSLQRHNEAVVAVKGEETIAAQNPLTLFKEMNRAAFGKKPSVPIQHDSPAVLVRQRGKQAKASVFDSNVNSAAPSVLMKATSRPSREEDSSFKSKQREIKDSSVVEEGKPPEQDESLMDSPVLLAVKAIGIATALVGTGALLTWEIGRRVLGVQNIDELIDRLAVIVPSRRKEQDALSGIGQAARKSLRSQENNVEWEEEVSRQNQIPRNVPMSTEEALEALDAAAQKGEAATWFSVLSTQLDAEREQDIEQRRQRIARQRRGALQEQLSV